MFKNILNVYLYKKNTLNNKQLQVVIKPFH